MDLTYLKDAAAGIPEDLERLKWSGKISEFEKYAELHCSRKDLPEAVKRCIQLELHKLKVNCSFYTLTEEKLIAEIAEVAPGFSKEDLDRIALDLDWAFVEGEKRYFESSRSALLTSNPMLRSWPGLKTEISDGTWVKNMTEKIRDKGFLGLEGEIERTVTVSEDAAKGCRLRVDIPYPSLKGTIMKSEEFVSADGDCRIAGEDAPARTAAFFSDGDERRTFTLRYRFSTEINYMSYEDLLAAGNGKTEYTGEGFTEEDLSERSPAIVFSPFIRELSRKIVGEETDKTVIAKKIYDYMLDNYRYSYVKDYAAIDHVGEYFAVRGRGDCGLQSLLFITLCRYNGIPARWESGITVEDSETGMHDWAAVYFEGAGWRPVDCSFGGGAMVYGNREAADFYFGNIDPYRVVFNTKVMAEFEPPKQHFRLDPYDSQTGEAEREDRMLTRSDFTGRSKVIWLKEY